MRIIKHARVFLTISIGLLLINLSSAADLNSAVNCGNLKALQFVIGADNKPYARIATTINPFISELSADIGSWSNIGGDTFIPLPEDQTQGALVYASLERALHDTNMFLYVSKVITVNKTIITNHTSINRWNIVVMQWTISR